MKTTRPGSGIQVLFTLPIGHMQTDKVAMESLDGWVRMVARRSGIEDAATGLKVSSRLNGEQMEIISSVSVDRLQMEKIRGSVLYMINHLFRIQRAADDRVGELESMDLRRRRNVRRPPAKTHSPVWAE